LFKFFEYFFLGRAAPTNIMLLTLEALQILDAIARNGSFAAAATELERVPSSLTYSVRKLEQDLDVLLFDRRGYRAKLTEAGAQLLEQGRVLLQAAGELERQVKRTARGWEVQLRLAIDNVIEFERLLPLIAEFDAEMCGTRLRFSFDVLNGVWEALLQGRADLVLGAAQAMPDAVRAHGGFASSRVAELDWVFAVAPNHPLATTSANEPLTSEQILQHRAVAVGDSGHSLPAVNPGLLSGQELLTVPTLRDKLLAQAAGLGCGHLPRALAAPLLADGRLIMRETVQAKAADTLFLAWRKPGRGKAMQWFLQRLSDPACLARLLGTTA
jgi:DNA-binding transcriptional LysR family regulator